jgi:hypothetical protein
MVYLLAADFLVDRDWSPFWDHLHHLTALFGMSKALFADAT